MKDKLFNMTQAWDKENIWVPDRNWTHDLLNTLLSSKFTTFIHLSLLTMNSTVLILAVCRAPVTYELSKMTLLSMRSCRSVACAQHVFGRSWVRFLSGTQIFSLLASCWIYLSQFITKLKTHHLHSLIKSFDFTIITILK